MSRTGLYRGTLRWNKEHTFAHLTPEFGSRPACGGRHAITRKGERTEWAPDDAPLCPACVRVMIIHAEGRIAYYRAILADLRAALGEDT